MLALALLGGLWLAACSGSPGIEVTTTTATATPSPDASGSPTPEPVATGVPERPDQPFAAGRDVEAYLRGGAADMRRCLPELVEEWGLAEEVEGPRCVSADLDGDGEDEWAFLVSYDSDDPDRPGLSDLWFFEDEEQDWRFFNSARGLANASAEGLQVRAVEDITNDDVPDLIATWLSCADGICITHLLVASTDQGDLDDLAPSNATVESLEEFEVADGAVRMSGGSTSTAETGPQRPSTTIVSWTGLRFRVESERGEPTYLVHLVNDADRLYVAGDYEQAQALYLDAAVDEALLDWKAEQDGPAGRPELQAYSLFRAALAAEQMGNLVEWVALVQRAVDEQGDTLHGEAAAVYLEDLQDEESSPQRACSVAEAYIEQYREAYEALWDFGSANPERGIFTLCR
ncbi:MAG: hypothetical protein WD800_00055 [Dehalococcoidia bacterium]